MKQIQKIAVSRDHSGYEMFSGVYFTHEMADFSGMIVQVLAVDSYGDRRLYCRLGGNPVFIERGGNSWYWTDEMVVKVKEM